jgi:hypothetical protein
VASLPTPAAIAPTTPPAAAESEELTFRLIEVHWCAERRYYEFTYSDDEVREKMLYDLGDEVEQLARCIARNEPSTLLGVITALEYTGETTTRTADGRTSPTMPPNSACKLGPRAGEARGDRARN